MTVEQDLQALRDALRIELRREEATIGRTIDDMELQARVLLRQRRARRGYNYLLSVGTGATGATGPAT